jgi:hypothetical protein
MAASQSGDERRPEDAIGPLTGNAPGNILIGGAGVDTITGGGRSIPIGGRGNDTVRGGSADDIVIGGFTDFDTSSDAHDQALTAILTEWRFARPLHHSDREDQGGRPPHAREARLRDDGP